MAAQGFVQTLARSLRLRVLALVLCGFALFCVPAYFAFSAVVNATIFQLGTLFAEKQVLYDRYRGLETLMREVSLAETLAGSQAIRDWASNETDLQARRRGLAELEHYRRAFADNSYFFVIDASGNYYFNDAANAYASNQLRYTVSPDNPRDGWYFTTRALGSGCHLNVDHDDNLGVTKVWMNCVIREGRRVLGILGTGIDLTAFIREVVDVPQPGVNAMFIDRTGAIQAHRDPELVDFHSLTKAMSSKSTVFAMLDREADRVAMREMLDSLAADPGGVRSRFMQVDGHTVLVGAGYLDRLGWFNVTLMDVDEIIDRHLFAPIAALLAVLMLGIALVLMLIFKRSVLDRLAGIASGVRQVEQGWFEEAARLSAPGTDEIARLGQSLATMARAVGETTRELEQRVAERTRELERLAYMDGLTGIANRRGLTEVFVRGMGGGSRGLMIVDLDHFKAVNDRYGHAAGDAVVIAVARRITAALGPDDMVARWGGDEFMVLLGACRPHQLQAAAHAVRLAICAEPIPLGDGRSVGITASIGACIVVGDDTIDAATDLADAALYMAKSDGRDRVVAFNPDVPARKPVLGPAA
jgi:diguanylate cyclase (GGDEF)-like protein